MGIGAAGRVVAAVGGEIAEAEAKCGREVRSGRLLWEQQEDEVGGRDAGGQDVEFNAPPEGRSWEEGGHVSQNQSCRGERGGANETFETNAATE